MQNIRQPPDPVLALSFREWACQVLRAEGRRLTSQRLALFELIEAAPGHPDADDLYRLARERVRGLSLSTVYRTLSLLKQHGLVDELHLSHEHYHYEPRVYGEHYHAACTACGVVEEFATSLVEQLKPELERQYGFSVTRVAIELSGRCRRCRATSAPSPRGAAGRPRPPAAAPTASQTSHESKGFRC